MWFFLYFLLNQFVDCFYDAKGKYIMEGWAMNFNEYVISKCVIPKLQREYVQGYHDKGEYFIDKIFEKLTDFNDNDDLVLDLVYDVEKDGTDGKTHEPIDGQQRLTTLYLLYLYIGSIEKQNIRNLKNFVYETRDSSTLFCEELVETFSEGFCLETLPSYIIKTHSKYRVMYDYDYTIGSMINMLDRIHSRYCNYMKDPFLDENKCVSGLFDRLNLIQFDKMDFGKYEWGDELYVIMNDRGKQLTAFENLKSSLSDWMRKNAADKDSVRDFLIKLDTTWSDAIWKKMDENETKTDGLLYRVFCRYFFELCVENREIKESRKENMNKCLIISKRDLKKSIILEISKG